MIVYPKQSGPADLYSPPTQVGGGTGWNIEAMSEFVNVPEFFSSVYLVDFSPSLCEVARKRFARLGWQNVKVICQDARKFRLEDHESDLSGERTPTRSPASYFNQKRPEHGGADLITMSYSLSMIVSLTHPSPLLYLSLPLPLPLHVCATRFCMRRTGWMGLWRRTDG